MKLPTPIAKRKRRYGLYECVNCGNSFETRTDSKTLHCTKCTNSWKKIDPILLKQPHKLYQTWAHELHRCTNKNSTQYYRYGGRGISIAEEFKDFKIWLQYVETLPNAYRDAYTIDRIDNDKGYERGNLRWVCKSVQAQNTTILQKNNTTGYRGVYLEHGKYRARIMANNVSKSLGTYKTAKEAAKAYDTYVIDNKLNHSINGV